jgi:putative transposase
MLSPKLQLLRLQSQSSRLVASLTRQELARQIAYLKAENNVLRSKLPKRIDLSVQQKRTLIKHGKKLGARIKEMITIVSYSTFRKWIREIEDAPSKRKAAANDSGGRPRIEESVSEAILRIRKETGSGYTKIVQALRRLGHKVSCQTVKNVIIEAGLGPEPCDHPYTWCDFIKRHAATMWQCDFACKKKWTIKVLVDVYFLVFIHIGSRRILISPCTEHPHATWTTQQARNFAMHIDEEQLPCTILMRDNDTKFTTSFDDIFKTIDCKIKRTPIKSPNLQAFVERVIQTIKHEVLNAFCIVSDAHLNHLLHVTQNWYNHRRCHSNRDHLPPVRDTDTPPTIELATCKLESVEELGGHLKSYRAAA